MTLLVSIAFGPLGLTERQEATTSAIACAEERECVDAHGDAPRVAGCGAARALLEVPELLHEVPVVHPDNRRGVRQLASQAVGPVAHDARSEDLGPGAGIPAQRARGAGRWEEATYSATDGR